MAGNSGWSGVARRHYQFLLDHMDPDFGLLTKLVAKKILSYEQRDIVKAETTANKRNGKLLEIIQSEDKWDELIDALRSSNQTHVVNYLEEDGRYSEGVEWPLGEREQDILRTNLEQLTDLIETTELIMKLHGLNVISKNQRDFIRGKQSSSDQNEAFIDILRRRSIADYNKTVHCLKETNQPHVAELLEKGGGIVRLHVNTNLLLEEERELAAKITEMIVSRPLEERGRILECVNLNVIAATTGQSVVLYAYLQTTKQLNQLRVSLESGSFKDSVQLFFNSIMSASKQISVSRVTVTRQDLDRLEDFLLAVAHEDSEKRLMTIQTNLSGDRKDENEMLSTSIRLSTLVRHKSILEEIIDPDSGLLDKLLIRRILNRREVQSIESESTYNIRNARLLEIITDQKQCNSFINSLRHTRQEHVVNYLIGDGIFRLEFGDIWPLTDIQRQLLKVCQGSLVSAIEVNPNFTKRLCAMQAIKNSEKSNVDSKGSSSEKAKTFLEILRRMNQIDFRRTINCLRDTKQIGVAENLDGNAVIVKLQISSNTTTDQKKHIVKEFTKRLHKGPISGSALSPELKCLSIIKVEMEESIAVYVTCKMLEDFNNLQSSLKSEKLELEIGRQFMAIFTKLHQKLRRDIVIGIFVENEDDAINFFKLKTMEIEFENEREGGCQGTASTSMDDLPLELLDLILQKFYLCCALQSDPKGLLSHQTIINRLASVNVCWFRRLIKRKLKPFIWRNLSDRYRNQSWKRHFIIRNNSHYFESSLQPPNQIRHLKFSDCLTDIEAACIQRQRQKIPKVKAREANSNSILDLIEIVKSLDEIRYSSFIRCLRQSGRRNIANVVSYGGAAIPLQCCIEKKVKSQTLDVASKLRKKLKEAESPKANQLQNTFKEFDVETLEVSIDRTFVCWIWCRSTKGLEKLQWTNASEAIFAGIVKTLGVGSSLDVLNVDKESFKKDMVFRSGVDSDVPLTNSQLKILNASVESLVYRIEMKDLVDNLLAKNVINERQKQLIVTKRTFTEKKASLSKILRRLSQKDFQHPIDCFKKSNAEGWIGFKTLSRHREFLEESIDPDSGLLDKLLSLTPQKIQSIKSEPTCYKRNAKLLNCITDQEKCVSFFESLLGTSQTHVVNYLLGNGKYKPEFGDDWPLTDSQKRTLTANEASLVDLIDLSDLLGRLYTKDILIWEQLNVIYSQRTSNLKNKAFLEILRRLSQKDFKQTIICLHETHQDDVAQILDKCQQILL